MKYIDMHVHSCYSDGTKTPEELVALAEDMGLVAFALTDHDTMSGIPDAMKASGNSKVEVIPGIELSTKYKSTEVHILGYYLDPSNAELQSTLNLLVERREGRNRKMCENLANAGYPIDYDSLCTHYPDAILTRAHFAKYLLEKGSIPSMDAAFRTILKDDSPYYVAREYLSSKEAVELILRAGGVPVLAHPLLYHFSVTQLRELIQSLLPVGLKGIEAMYSCNRGTDEAFVRKLAKENNLLCTGGSDYHGDNKPHIELGRGMGTLFVPCELWEGIKAAR